MQYTQAQIDRANAVSLEDFLRTQGETLIKSGREYRWKEHDSLTIRGNKWFRHSQSKGGYPIDFVMEFYGKSFPEAVQLLTGESGEGQTEATTTPPTEFHLPLHNRTADRAIQYLCESRGLNKTLVEAFLLSGDIYEDAKRHNVVFVGRDRNGTPRYAHVRGTADTFRQDITGSDKSYPFRYEGNGNQLFVFEAPIDLLSFICLYAQTKIGSEIKGIVKSYKNFVVQGDEGNLEEYAANKFTTAVKTANDTMADNGTRSNERQFEQIKDFLANYQTMLTTLQRSAGNKGFKELGGDNGVYKQTKGALESMAKKAEQVKSAADVPTFIAAMAKQFENK